MPKRNNSYNAFYFFMKDWQKNEERKGFVFPNGIRDVQSNPNCNEAWKVSILIQIYFCIQ